MTDRIRNVHAQELYTLAQDDALTLNFPLPDAIYGFHAQQAFEKAMKALISVHGRRYPLTHELKDLVDLLRSCGEELPPMAFDLLSLQPYAVELRYHLGEQLKEQQRVSMRDAVLQYNRHALNRMLQLEATAEA